MIGEESSFAVNELIIAMNRRRDERAMLRQAPERRIHRTSRREPQYVYGRSSLQWRFLTHRRFYALPVFKSEADKR